MRAEGAARRAIVLLLAGALLLGLVPSRAVAEAPDARSRADQTERDPPSGEGASLADVTEAWWRATDRLIVTPRAGVALQQAGTRAEQFGGVGVRTGRAGRDGYHVLELDEDLPLEQAEALADRLVVEGLVVHAEPDARLLPLQAAVNDPEYATHQWHLHGDGGVSNNHGINVEAAWSDTAGSEGVVVAVIDTGVLPHEDIADRLLPGYDFVDGNADPSDPGDHRIPGQCGLNVGAWTSTWHGLHVAGTVGATTNNAIGVAGVDQRARILPVRVLGPCGGTIPDVVDAIRWSAGLTVDGVPANPTPADVINLSLGAPGNSCGSTLQTAINDAVGAGVVVVVAAGNDATLAANFRPANCANVVTVAATSALGDRAAYSNHGTAVDIAAPGGDGAVDSGVRSLINSSNAAPQVAPAGWQYGSKQGTSMAAPHVSGAASLILAADPNLSPADVKELLEETARAFPTDVEDAFRCSSDPESSFTYCGKGIVDAGDAVAAAVTGRPLGALELTADVVGDDVELSWNALDPGTTYRVYRSEDAWCSADAPEVWSGNDEELTDSPGDGVYRYCVRGELGGDLSPLSEGETVEVGSSNDPLPPLIFGATAAGEARLAWTPVEYPPGTPVGEYQLHRSSAEEDCGTGVPVVTTADLFATQPISTAAQHYFCVVAAAGGSTSVASTPIALTGVPPAPDLSATPGDKKVTLSWSTVTHPAEIERYVVFRTTSSTCSFNSTPVYSGGGTSTTVTSLTNGTTYRFCVYAVSGNQLVSARSAQKSATPAGSPPAKPSWPSDATLSFDLASNGLRLSWPKASGTVSAYDVFVDGKKLGSTTSRSATITGLTNGRRYKLEVRARNSGGSSPALTRWVRPSSGFSDTKGSRFETDIRWLATAEVTLGCTSTRYCPTEPVTRGQMARFLVRALDLEKTSGIRFQDVPSSLAEDVDKLATARITLGCTSTRFCPTDPVTRGQMAAFLVRGLGLTATSGKQFSDVPPGSTFHRDIDRLATAGVTQGCTSTRFCPTDSVTRQQMAAFLRRALAG